MSRPIVPGDTVAALFAPRYRPVLPAQARWRFEVVSWPSDFGEPDGWIVFDWRRDKPTGGWFGGHVKIAAEAMCQMTLEDHGFECGVVVPGADHWWDEHDWKPPIVVHPYQPDGPDPEVPRDDWCEACIAGDGDPRCQGCWQSVGWPGCHCDDGIPTIGPCFAADQIALSHPRDHII